MSSRVLVSIVTFNSAQHLKACLESIKTQTYADLTVALWDNASSDETQEIVADYRNHLDFIHYSKSNVGFCKAHNCLITSIAADYVLVLNPDVVLDSGFVEIMVREMDRDLNAGSASGKLWRRQIEQPDPGVISGLQNKTVKVLDTTGIYITPNQRHFDRGSGEIDRGQYDTPEYVFGASGAAAFYRRAMLEDVRIKTQYFDEAFFAYREDADLAWRAQWMGWSCLYIPEAKGIHVRKVLPERRSILPDAINMHSFKNRFLLRAKNMDVGTYACFFIPITIRDLAALFYVNTWEWSSLGGIPLLMRALPAAWTQRKIIKNQRRASAQEIRSWFSYQPIAKPKI